MFWNVQIRFPCFVLFIHYKQTLRIKKQKKIEQINKETPDFLKNKS